ncbi:MAG: outer membrane beta-barrel protein [Thiotrichales bacterium]|nr:MAG: outer membrane beta-barrel protein [Thiotrichales bacterium]
MYKYIFSLAAAGLIVLFADHAAADTDDSPYLGIQYAFGNVGVDTLSTDFNPTTLVARVGKFFHRSYSVEGRIAFPLQDDTKTVSGNDATVGLFGLLGAYGTARLNWQRYSIYGIAGLSLVEGEIKVSSTTQSDSELGISYGAGLDIRFGGTLVNLEYLSYLDESSFDFDALGIGVTIVF